MIVVNKKGIFERNIMDPIVGEGFHLIIVFKHEIRELLPGTLPKLLPELMTRIYEGGSLIIAETDLQSQKAANEYLVHG